MANPLDEKVLQAMFDSSQTGGGGEKMKFSPEEASRFRKAFADPEFRKMFAEYMDELQDPKNREETEAYINQLEGEQKVPEGKELIRPIAGFVAKVHKLIDGDSKSKDKVFLNIVQSEKIALPTKTPSAKGDYWSVPYSLGPPHMEKDKKGDNATCFDCCFHPEALRLGEKSADFKTLLINTGIEGVEEFYKRSNQKIKLEREFHVVKGLAYKEGMVPTMLIASASKDNWKSGSQKPGSEKDVTVIKKKEPSSASKSRPDPPSSTSDDEKTSTTDSKPTSTPVTTSSATTSVESAVKSNTTESKADDSSNATETKKDAPSSSSAKSGTKVVNSGLRRGFLNSSKSSLYPEKIPTIRPKTQENGADASGRSFLDDESTLTGSSAMGASDIPHITNILHPESTSTMTKSDVDSAMKVVSSKPRAKPAVVEQSASSGTSSSSTSTISDNESISKEDASIVKAAIFVGPQEPIVVCKHREAVTLGDFENNKPLVHVNRPTDLVYEIQLPLASAPSKIILDVSEKKLVLTYLDIYKLDMPLPYKVLDKKGKASYDKSKKMLRVTLPVDPTEVAMKLKEQQDAAPATIETISSTTTSTESDEKDITPTNASTADEKSSSPSKSSATTTTTSARTIAKGKEHNRWVSKEDAAKEEEGVDPETVESKKLFEEVQRQAELAKKAASEKASLPAVKKTDSLPKVVDTNTTAATAVAAAEVKVAESREEYIATTTFQGRKVGYVFRRGDEGVGYYLDKPLKPVEELLPKPPKLVEPKKQVDDVILQPPQPPKEYHIPSYKVQQTKDAVSIIFDVPNILTDSVHITVTTSYSLQVLFQTLDSATSNHATTENTTYNGFEKKSYGLVLTLQEQIAVHGWKALDLHYDVAKKNMVVVVLKEKPSIWSHPDQPTNADTSVWITASKYIAVEKETIKATEKELMSSNNNITSTAATGKKDENAAAMETLQSMLSTMQFSTDILSELD